MPCSLSLPYSIGADYRACACHRTVIGILLIGPKSYWFQLGKKMHLSLRTTRGMFGSCALAAALLVAAGIAQAKTPTWVATKGKVRQPDLDCRIQRNAGGFNFNGAAKGQLTVTVPLGDTVNVTFSNNSQLPHSAQIVAFSKSAPVSAVSDAFKNAHSANPTSGVGKGTTQKFSFAAKQGRQVSDHLRRARPRGRRHVGYPDRHEDRQNGGPRRSRCSMARRERDSLYYS